MKKFFLVFSVLFLILSVNSRQLDVDIGSNDTVSSLHFDAISPIADDSYTGVGNDAYVSSCIGISEIDNITFSIFLEPPTISVSSINTKSKTSINDVGKLNRCDTTYNTTYSKISVINAEIDKIDLSRFIRGQPNLASRI